MNGSRAHPPSRDATGRVAVHAAARPRWRTWAVRGLTLVFFAAVAALLAHQARTIEWDTVGATLRGYRPGTLALAALFVGLSYLAYAGYELLAKRYSGHAVRDRLVARIGAISYCFNLNLGAWLGGIGFRYRLYSQLGVGPATTARVYLSVLKTNWSGYLLVAAVAFGAYGLDLPPQWQLSDRGLRGIGALLGVAAVVYLLACAKATRRSWSVRGHEFELPDGRQAVLQMALGAANWMLMGAVVYTLLPHVDQAPRYGTVLATLLLASIAGVATHIPAGLGVLEALFLALLGHRVPHAQLLGALLAYRAMYFIGPLIVAGLSYAALESAIRAGRIGKRS